jgi:hypothetical protein
MTLCLMKTEELLHVYSYSTFYHSKTSIIYFLLLLLLHSPYVLTHTAPLFQIIYGDVLCTRNLANTVLPISTLNTSREETYT